MRATDALLTIVAAFALVGCQLGCDGERPPRTAQPRAPHLDDAGVGAGSVEGDGDGGLRVGELQTGQYLDAPPGSLDMFFKGLAAIERGEAARVLISEFGDSHTAGDYLTGHMRHRLQAKFGDAGRGLVAAGKPPVTHYYQKDVGYGRTGLWNGAVGGKKTDEEPFGILGIRVTGQKKGAQLWVETCATCAAGTSTSQFEILYYVAPDRGSLKYRVDEGAWQTLNTRATAIEPPHPARQIVAVQDGAHKLTLEHAGGGRVDLFGVALERLGKPGVIVDNYGIVGRRVTQLRAWDWAIIGEQLATRDPRLVILQYGTNEADDHTTVLEDVAKAYDDTIVRIRASAPTASIIILGPPDMGAREGGKSCDRIKPPKAGIDAGVIPECEWHTPGILRDIVAVQHAAAARNKVAFFDTFAAMGGAEQMHAFFSADPRIAFGDHVHFTELGYQRWAEAFASALLDNYARWKPQQQAP